MWYSPTATAWTARLTPSAPSAVIPASQSAWAVFATYVPHGIEHIWFGFDHLLFVTGLMLIVRDWRKLVKAITAFTAAHSITLDLRDAWMGDAALAAGRGDDCISIVMVAAEVVRMERGQLSLAIVRGHGSVAFAFGLLHGFGFASALVELGLPQGDIPLALLAFNVGVELGQLAFIAVLLSAVYCMRRLVLIPSRQPSHRPMQSASSRRSGAPSGSTRCSCEEGLMKDYRRSQARRCSHLALAASLIAAAPVSPELRLRL